MITTSSYSNAEVGDLQRKYEGISGAPSRSAEAIIRCVIERKEMRSYLVGWAF